MHKAVQGMGHPIPLATDILLIYCQSTSHSIRKQTNKKHPITKSLALAFKTEDQNAEQEVGRARGDPAPALYFTDGRTDACKKE